MKNIVKKISLLGVSLMLGCPLMAQSNDSIAKIEKDYTRGWYIGAQAGMPMAEAGFSSFGADKFRPGWSAGIHAGYRFTPVWSLEFTANWGQQFLAEQDCCFERGYFLGSDHNRYHPLLIPNDMQGRYYKDIKSRTFVQRYGLQANINVLGFFNRTKDSRWRLELSPAVYAVGTSTDLMTKSDNTPVADNLNEWHLGYGAQAQVSYAVAKNMNIGLYGGFTHLTGKPMDGMPELHSTNFIIDAGVKFSFAFGKRKRENEKRKTDGVPAVVAPTVQSTEQRAESKEERAEITEVVAADTETELKAENEKVKTEEDFSCQISDFTFPVVYFSFNSVWIEPNEKAKIRQIADIMKANPEMRVRVTGWGDNVGGEEANKRVSLQRAEAVKRMLGKWLIPVERVETVGAGIAHDASSREEARHAATIEITEQK